MGKSEKKSDSMNFYPRMIYKTKSILLLLMLYKKIAYLYISLFPFRIRGFWMYGHPDNSGIVKSLLRGEYEDFATDTMIGSIKKGEVVCDIGAHVGYYTMLFSRLVGESGKVYAFEPDVVAFKLLNRNIRLNRLKNVIAQKVAIASSKGVVKLYLSKEDPADHRLFNPEDEERENIKVSQDTLDNILYNKRLDLIKIDVQGFEGECMDGAAKLLKTNKNLRILLEFWPKGLRDRGINPRDLIIKIHSFGYKIYFLDEANKKRVLMKNINKLIQIGDKNKFINLYCVK